MHAFAYVWTLKQTVEMHRVVIEKQTISLHSPPQPYCINMYTVDTITTQSAHSGWVHVIMFRLEKKIHIS